VRVRNKLNKTNEVYFIFLSQTVPWIKIKSITRKLGDVKPTPVKAKKQKTTNTSTQCFTDQPKRVRKQQAHILASQAQFRKSAYGSETKLQIKSNAQTHTSQNQKHKSKQTQTLEERR
jgi:hypothetical protein